VHRPRRAARILRPLQRERRDDAAAHAGAVHAAEQADEENGEESAVGHGLVSGPESALAIRRRETPRRR
jgi:hypothetical protein